MAETNKTASPGTKPGEDELAASERRRAQNRLAQRRHRQRQAALKKQAAFGGDSAWVTDNLNGMAQTVVQPGDGLPLFDTPVSLDANDSFSAFPTASDLDMVSWDLPPWNTDLPTLLPPAVPGFEPPESAREAALAIAQRVSAPTDPVFSNDRTETLVHTAARGNDVATLRLLAQAGCRLDERDDQGRTALHAAYEDHRIEAIVWLLEQGVDVDAVDKHGRTMLSMAVNNKCSAAVRLLLSHGASASPKHAEQVRMLSKNRNDG